MNDGDRITEEDRYPTLTAEGRSMIRMLREHARAPIFRNESGNRLTSEDVEKVRVFEREVEAARPGWRPGGVPFWLDDFVELCFNDVPFYRRLGSRPVRFQNIPTITRADLGRDIAQFVPDSIPLDRLINFQTSGTTGHSLLLPSLPAVAACYLPFHKRALRRFGIELRYGRGQVGNVLLGYQRNCFTYVSVTPSMDESGLAKINLHPADWRDPEDRAAYLDALAPEVLTGDPISFGVLLSLPVRIRPKALISTSMTLLPGLRQKLEEQFGCPVLDVYSMNEAGPIGIFDQKENGHVLLQHRLYIEVLDTEGRSATPGAGGEVTISGGFNTCLPLLRYRTGDYASLRFTSAEPVLEGLEGRPPVLFRTMSGEMINNIEVTHALKRFSIPQFTVHQNNDGSISMLIAGAESEEDAIRAAMINLFGPGQRIEMRIVQPLEGKVIQYTSDLSEVRSEDP